MIDYKADISAYLEQEIRTIQNLDIEQVNQALNLLLTAFEGEVAGAAGTGAAAGTAAAAGTGAAAGIAGGAGGHTQRHDQGQHKS